MANSAINTQVAQQKIGNVQNQADSSSVYSAGAWDFKNASAVTSVKIDASGNVGIGKSPTYRLDVQGAVGENATLAGFFSGTNTTRGFTIGLSAGGGAVNDGYVVYNHTLGGGNSGHIWQAGGTERMRIDASGRLSVGNLSSSNTIGGLVNIEHGGVNSQNGFTYYFNAASPTGHGFYVNSPQTGTNTANWNAFYSRVAGGDRFYVTGAGTIYATNTTVQPIASDRNLKQDIIDFDKGLPELLKMKPRYFSFKNEPSITQAGFIAQEMDEALPGAMVDSLSKPEEGEQPFKTYQVDWYPLLVKAIQELSAKVDAQAAEIAALKAS